MLTCPCNVYPITPHFYIVKLGFTRVYIFLAHLSRRLIGGLIVYPCTGIGRRRSPFSNIFSFETSWPIKAKLYVEPPREGGTKVCINGLGHMTKMGAPPIYGKNPSKIFFSRTRRPMILKLGMQHRGIKLYKVCINCDPGLTLTYFTAKSNLET